jgi:DnaJ-class molecular chaperone
MTKDSNKEKEVAMTLRGFKKCSLCQGRGEVSLSNHDLYGTMKSVVCNYCKGTGWVVPRIVKAQ